MSFPGPSRPGGEYPAAAQSNMSRTTGDFNEQKRQHRSNLQHFLAVRSSHLTIGPQLESAGQHPFSPSTLQASRASHAPLLMGHNSDSRSAFGPRPRFATRAISLEV